MSPAEKKSPINRRTLHRKMLKAYIRGKEHFQYKGEEYPVLYTVVDEEE